MKIRSSDIKSANLQGKQKDRIILYRIPKGGIPEEGIYEGDVMAAWVPIYGTKDAGRGLWLRLREVTDAKSRKIGLSHTGFRKVEFQKKASTKET